MDRLDFMTSSIMKIGEHEIYSTKTFNGASICSYELLSYCVHRGKYGKWREVKDIWTAAIFSLIDMR